MRHAEVLALVDEAQPVHATCPQGRCCRLKQRELHGYCLGRAKFRFSKRHSDVEDVDVDSIPRETLLFADFVFGDVDVASIPCKTLLFAVFSS